MSLQDSKKIINIPEENTQETVDIDLSSIAKKRFRINGDDSKILYLNTSDMMIMDRFRTAYPKLIELAQEASKKLLELSDSDIDNKLNKFADSLKDINTKMCEYVDYIFDANVSEVCLDGGSMYDPFNGQFRFQHIFDKLFNLYADNISKEYTKLSNHIKRYTNKYTKGK